MKRATIVFTALAVAIVALLYYIYGGGNQVPPGQAPLASLTAENFSTIKDQFNAARDSVRVVLWLSPT